MKHIIAILFVACGLAIAQVNPPTIWRSSRTTPSGSCAAGTGVETIPGGLLYTCQNGTWVQISGGGGSSLAPFTTDGTNVALPSGTLSVGQALLVPMATPTSGPVTVSAWGFYFNNASGAMTFNLPVVTSATVGAQYCFRNFTGKSGAITLQAPASTYFDVNGANGSVTGTLVSGGALGDSVCVVSISTTEYMAYPGNGTWTNN